jgi:hypothetical protein
MMKQSAKSIVVNHHFPQQLPLLGYKHLLFPPTPPGLGHFRFDLLALRQRLRLRAAGAGGACGAGWEPRCGGRLLLLRRRARGRPVCSPCCSKSCFKPHLLLVYPPQINKYQHVNSKTQDVWFNGLTIICLENSIPCSERLPVV